MEKLNKIERLKANLHPFDYYKQLEKIDFSNINEADRFYLKNFGIYNIKMRPNVYMLRVRVDGGKISKNQLELLAKIALKYNLKILLTARAQIELHQILPKDILNVFKEVNSQIPTWQTLTDNFRAIITSEYNSKKSPIYCYDIIKDIQDSILKNPKYVGMLPRKFNTAIIGDESVGFNFWGNDLVFVLAKKDETLGFNVYLGGKNSEVAKSANIFCTKDEVKEIFLAIANIFLKHQSRDSRAKLRLFFLIEKLGMQRVRELIELELKRALQTEGTLLVKSSKSFEEPFFTKHFGRFGEIDAKEILDAIKRFDNFRLSPRQMLLAIDFNKEAKNSDILELNACAGSRYCALSLWDIKRDLDPKLLNIFKKYKISFGFSGCLKGCGRHHHSDIGFIGLRTNLYAKTELAIRVYIGSVQMPKQMAGRLLYYSVPKRAINTLLFDIIDDFKASGFKIFEEFSYNVLNRYDIEFLQLWYLLKGLKIVDKKHQEDFLALQKDKILDSLEIELNSQTIKELSHKLWDLNEN